MRFVINILLLGAFLFNSNLIFSQTKVGKSKMPDKVKAGNTILQLNGSGIREKFWMDMYACGLYLEQNSSNSKNIITTDRYAAIKIHIISSLITSEKMVNAVEEGFKKSFGENLDPIRKEIDVFKKAFSTEDIKKNDIYDIVYKPDKGTIIMKNGSFVSIIKGALFKKALLGIWLGANPADKNLKKALLNLD